MVYIDENGDAAGNYTLLYRKKMQNQSFNEYGLVPVGTFIDTDNGSLPVNSCTFVNVLCI